MKKLIFSLIIVILSFSFAYSKEVEIAATFSFGKPFEFWTGWDPNDGVSPSFDIKFITEKNEFIFFSVEEGVFYTLKLDGSVTKNFSIDNYNRYNTDVFYSSFFNGYIIGFNNNLGNRNEINAKCKILDAEKIIYREDGGSMRDAYLTGNTLFWGNLASLEFLTDGNYKIRNVDETKAWLENGKGEELGWSQKISKRNGKILDNGFGDIEINSSISFYSSSCFDNAYENKEIGNEFDALLNSNYNNFAKDSKGLVYFKRYRK